MALITCTGCGQPKGLAEFNRQQKSAIGRRRVCRDCTRAAKRQWNADRREHLAAYRKANAKAEREYHRRWRAENRERDNAYSAKRRARARAAAVEDFTWKDVLDYWDSIGAYACVACDGPFEHVDHVMPLALGGAHAIDNLLPMCESCNTSKGAKDPWVWAREQGFIK